MITKREAAIITAYTNFVIGDFNDFHKYAEEIIGRPIFTHEFSDKELIYELHCKSTKDFLDLEVEN